MENNTPTRWIDTVLRQLSETDHPQAATVVEQCGRECLKTSGFPRAIAELKQEIGDDSDVDTLFTAYKECIYNNSFRLQKHGDVISLEYHRCGCGIVTEGGVTDPFLCNCTVGYTRQLFESLFDRPVSVVLKKSILRGDDICLQIITLTEE